MDAVTVRYVKNPQAFQEGMKLLAYYERRHLLRKAEQTLAEREAAEAAGRATAERPAS